MTVPASSNWPTIVGRQIKRSSRVNHEMSRRGKHPFRMYKVQEHFIVMLAYRYGLHVSILAPA
jgi:hypothetical protein